MEREDGYYWVRSRNQESWIVAEWINGSFWLAGIDDPYQPGDFAEIGAKIERS